MTSFVVTLADDAVAAAKAALTAIEGVIITDIQQDLEPGLLSFLQNAGSAVLSSVGSFFSTLYQDVFSANGGTNSSSTPVVADANTPSS